MGKVPVLLIMLTVAAVLPLEAVAAAPAPPEESFLPPSYVYVRYSKPGPGEPYAVVEVVAVVVGYEGLGVRFAGDLVIRGEGGDVVHAEGFAVSLVGGEVVVARYRVPPEQSAQWLSVEVRGVFRVGKCSYLVRYGDVVWAPPVEGGGPGNVISSV